MSHLTEIIETGGLTLIALVLLSVLAAVLFIERLLATAGLEQSAEQQSEQIIRAIYQSHWDEMRSVAQRMPHAIAPMFQTLVARASAGKTDLRGTFERQRQLLTRWLRARLWLLGTIAAAAPFVGLFGTVVGIMQSFRDIADTGGGGFAVVSRGLSEALITTAAGIIVAVEAVVFYNFLQARLGRIAVSVKLAGEELLEVLAERPPLQVAATATPPAGRGNDAQDVGRA